MGFQYLISQSELRELDIQPTHDRLGQWLRHLDLEFYRLHPHCNGVADLAGLTRDELIRHFILRGCKEGRSYSSFLYHFIDPDFYRARYPELNLTSGEDAVRHWMYEGFFDGRVPNSMTNDAVEADYHLFQFGKVASKAIQQALYSAGHTNFVLHLHWSNDLLRTHPDCMLTYGEILNSRPQKVINFITGVRDPFERMISGYFQSNFESSPRYTPAVTAARVGKELMDYFVERNGADMVLNWFGHQFYRGVDIYRHAFDRQQGYCVIEENNTRIFLYRFENLSSLNEPLSKFTGLPIAIPESNRSAQKDYGELYQSILQTTKFPRETGEKILASQFVRHFYTDAEIERMRVRWLA